MGKIVVKCFVAVDKHDNAATCSGTGNARTACTCRSLPVCIKFKIVGSAPAFIAPTPLEANSLDDHGTLVPGRTDVAACEGFDMVLPLVATDADQDDVRIFVQDLDVNHGLYSARRDWYRKSGGLFNADFFDSAQVSIPQNCGRFQGYGAVRVGDNAVQPDLSPSGNETSFDMPGTGNNAGSSASPAKAYIVKSVNGGYRSEIHFKQQPLMEVRYSPSRLTGNGIDVTSAQVDACVRRHGSQSRLACREKLANMDQVICAYAYDNSRKRVGRWVGKSDPNGDDIEVWQRDHSNGDQASPQHCWRIVLQSPPSFITDADGEESPFSKEWIENTTVFTPTSGEGYQVEAAMKVVPMAVTQYRKLRFVAQDPQAKDAVQIMVLEDPGIVNNMKLGRSLCVERGADAPMCRADDLIDQQLYPNQPWMAPLNAASRSGCSRAERYIEYTALASEAGKQYRVCLVARDDSDVCAGVAPSASTRGWYGETHCIIFDVLRPALEWTPETLSLFSSTNAHGELVGVEVEAVVGCLTELTIAARDVSKSAVTLNATGNYMVEIYPQSAVPLPEGVVLTTGAPATRYTFSKRQLLSDYTGKAIGH